MLRFYKLVAALMVCALGTAAWAEPTENNAPNHFLSKQGVVTALDETRQNVKTTASQLVLNAMGLMGVPYKRGGTSATTGFDCSGFVRTMYEQTLGLVLPRRAADQAKAAQTIPKTELQPGDLVFFNTLHRAFSHVGIYIGDGKFIHSPSAGSSVRVDDMSESYWSKRFNGARRVDALLDTSPVAP